MSDIKRRILDPKRAPFERLILIMEILRSEGGCNWDRQQTHKSLLPYLIEESYEVIEAIEADDKKALKEELGDLLCQIVFHARIASEEGFFEINDSVKSICDKLVRRHPHIFDNPKDLKPEEVRDQWEKIKISSGEKDSVLGGLPRSMPALTRAFRIGEKAGGVGFDWKEADDVFEKMEEEIKEVREAASENNKEHLTEEIGDLLFAVASLARKLGIDPERALGLALDKFTSRFMKLEATVKESSRNLPDLTLQELEQIWQEAKVK